MSDEMLGQEMLRKRPPSKEDDYFAKQDQSHLDEEKKKLGAAKAQLDKIQRKELHYMCCPKCGSDLVEADIRKVAVDRCDECGGIWLDKGELEQLAGQDEGFIGSVIKSLFGR